MYPFRCIKVLQPELANGKIVSEVEIMDSMQPKKLIIINILEILKRYSDADHPLKQQDIIDILRRDYGMETERKAVSRNIKLLMDCGCYDIEHNGGWYLNHDFDDSEIRLLIDSIIFSKHIPGSLCRSLIEKLKGLSSKYFSPGAANIVTLYERRIENKQLSYTLEILDEAITKLKQVEFTYNEFGTDKKLHPRMKGDEVRRYLINPLRIVAANGRYYLICNNDKYDSLANYRLDKITDIVLLDTPQKDHKKIKGIEQGLNVPKHLAEHIYMFAGESVPVRFRINNSAISDVIDWFGADTVFIPEDEGHSTVMVTVNRSAMLYWAMQYSQSAEVLSPEDLRQDIRQNLAAALKKYET